MTYGTVNADLMTTSDGISAAGLYGFKNRLINSDMRIDQRNAGASGTASGYTVDRWVYTASQASKGTWQQNAGAVTPPVGFTNYLGFTSSSAYSVLTGDYFSLFQNIEGLNVSDLAWGTANAATVTLSFWVRSSLTGTFGGSLRNATSDRSYPFSYTINSANTWEKETITITGDTSGTWLKTNGIGLQVWLSLGAGATFSGTAGAWAGANIVQPTGSTSVVGTNGATFYITGVQLEKGSTATSFDYLDYGRSLAQCQRYAYVVSTTNLGSTPHCGTGLWYTTANALHQLPFPVTMRTAPTFTNTSAVLSLYIPSSQITSTTGSTTGNSISSSSVELYTLSAGTTTAGYATSTRLTSGSFTFSSEL